MLVTFPDHTNAEVLSANSDPVVPEDEVHVAAQRLTQDFLCHVIEEEEGWGKKAEDTEHQQDSGKESLECLQKVPPLGAILGKLPSAGGLDLQQDLESAAEPEGETRTTNITEQA